MVKIKLGHRTYKMSKRMTIEQWKALQPLDFDNPVSWAKIMSIGFKQPVSKFINVHEDSNLLGAGLILNEVNKRRETQLVDFTQFSIGEFIDLDIYIVQGWEKNLDVIIEHLCPKPLKYIDEALWAIEQYSKFRTSIYRQYRVLFGIDEQGVQEREEEEYNPNKVAKGWYSVLVDLADDDLLKLDPITEQPLKKALNFMALRKERIMAENAKQLQQKRQHDLQRNRR